jgi:hypothetical protein
MALNALKIGLGLSLFNLEIQSAFIGARSNVAASA